MPFSYDINPDESSRTRRRSQRIETENSERIEYKALGQNLGQLARGAVAFDPNAEDGDGDGLVQDNTPYERPAPLSNIADTIRQGLASTTGSTSLFNNGFSPLQGMTNREVAEYAVPDNPIRFLEMRLEQQSLLRLPSDNPFIKDDLEKVSFDPEGIEQLRNLVEKTLDDRPALRVAWDRFGVPPIGISSGDNKYDGVFLSDSILMDDDSLKAKPVRSAMNNLRIMNLMSSSLMGSSRIKGVKRTFVGTDPTDTLTHEWGHYLQTLTQQIHPDYKIREAATLLDAYWWGDSPSYYQDKLDRHPKIKRLYDYFNNLDNSYGVTNDPPDESIPFVASSYGTTKPGEFVAESISAYFSPDKKTRALLNDAGVELVEEVFLGIGRGGLASTSGGRRTTTGNSMRGLTPAEMAERIVPSTLEEALLSIGDHQAITAFDNESKDVKPEAMKMVVPNGVDDLDFSPETVKEMREVITKALAENRMFREMVERHGFPPVMATKRGSQWRDGEDTYAVSMIEGFPSIIVNKDVRNAFLALDGTYNETYSDMGMLEGTEGFLVDVSENSIIAHEWGHYINRNAAASHPDPEIRALAAFWFSDSWDYDAGLKGIWKALDKMGINVGDDKVSQRIIGAKRFSEKVKNGKSQKWTGYPHVMSQYGQTIPAEAFAEAVAAILLDKEGLRNKVSPAMREDVLDILGRPEAYERDIARGIDEGRAGLASFSVPRNQDGDMIIPSRTAGDPDVDKTPLGGRDYLKDATNEEIADTIAVRSMDDFVSMTLMNMLYGQDPSNSSAYISQLVDAIRFSFFPETRGQRGHFIDFTPKGVDRTRQIINNALDASPEFAWIMRTFGSVPIVSIDPDEIDNQRAQELLTGTKIISDEAGSKSIMGWSLGMLGIVLNTSSKAGRKRHPIGQRQRSTAQVRNENNQIEEFLMNVDLSMEGTLYHEYFHSFYDRVLGWHKAMKANSGIVLPGDRTDRQNYLYPGVAGVDQLTRLLKESFDEEGFIPYSTLKPSFVDPIIGKARRKIARNNDNEDDFLQIMAMHDAQLGADGGLWTPELSRRTLEKIRARYPYLVDDLAPLIAVHYGTASRQEHFAEGGLLFVTPDKRQRSNYLSPELEAIYAYILGLKSDPSPGDYNKPWLERSGLASRSQSNQRSINTLNERVHTGKELFVQSGGAEKRPDVIGRSDNMTDVSINGYNFSISGKLPELQEAYDGWNDWQENWRMRYISSEIMGLDGLPSQTDTRMWQSIANNHLKNGTLNEASYDTRNDIQRSTMLSLSLMREIASSERPTDTPLYRSISNVGENDSIARLRIGETLSMPLTSFSPDYNSVVGFSKNNDQSSVGDSIRPTGNVIVKLNPGAKVVDSPVRKQTPTDDGREINMPIESITAGEFVVKSKTNVNGIDVIELEQSRVIDPIPGLASESLSGDIVNDYALVKRTQMNREKIDSIPEVHEHSKWLTSLRTPKERKERIMALLESLAIRDFSTQSVDEAIDDIARDIERMAQSGLFNRGEGELRPDDAQNYWYIQSAIERATQVLKRAIYRDVVDDEESDRLANRVDEWEMDFRVTDPSGGPSNMFEEFGLASTSNLTPEQRGVYTSIQERVTGLASRGTPTNPIGKSTEEIAKEIELTPEEMKILEDLIPNADKIADIDVNPALKDSADELLGSVRVTVGDDGIPFVYASPHPFLSEEIPDKRNWSAVVRPNKETLGKVKELIDNLVKKSMGEDTPEEFWARSTGDGDKTEITEAFREEARKLRTSFTTWAKDLLDNVTSTKQETPSRGEFRLPDSQGQPTWLGMWAESLRNLESPSVLTFFGDNELTSHDVWGHLGTGRGFDRHGEWANMLAMFSLMDRWAEEKGISKEELVKLKASWFQSFEFGRIDGEFKPPVEQIRQEDKWYIKQWAIDSAFDFADTADLEELISLIDDGNTHSGASKGLASTSGSELAEIAKIDIVRQSIKKNETRKGLASSSGVQLSRSETDIAKRAKEILQKEIDEKRAEIDELKELNRRLRLAMEELQATGSWQGEKYDIRINDQGKLPPATATREEIEAQALKNGITLDEEVAKYVKEAEAAGYRRKYEIDQLQKKLDAAQENFDTVTKERSDNTFHMEELLAIPEIKEEILRRREEVLGLSYSDRDKRWSDPNDPDAYYVIHWGASQFVGGELDPARSRGVDGPIQAENTRSINLYTAKPYVEETTRLREVQETTKRVLADFAAEKDMNVGPPGRITSRERKILEDYNLGSAINDDGTIKWDEIKESLGDGYKEWLQKQVARIQEDLDKQEPRIARRERISAQLVADGYQYSSAYNARALTQGFAGYGGRYADEGAEIGAGASSGERATKSPITGIHIFRVTPETATSLGGGEDHLIGKHKPIATLVAKNDGMSDTNPAVNAWEGWVDMAIQQDIQSRAGLASTSRNPLSGVKNGYVQSIDEDITSRREYISKLEKALKEWNETGVWKGGDYGVVITPGRPPRNMTREQMLEVNYNPDNFAGAVEERLGKLRNEVSGLEKSRERIGKQPETTTPIEAILDDQETLARIEKRAKEVSAMSRAERSDLFRDGDYEYVVHWGADTLDGGVLDPARSRGDETSTSTVGNTRRINKVTSMQLVAERDDKKQKLADLTKIQQEFEETGLVNLSSAENPFGVERLIGSLISRGKDRNANYHGDRAYRPFPDEDDLNEMGIDELTPEMKENIATIIERSRNGSEQTLARLDKVADKLIEDDYQYSSTYPAEKLATANGYGGRYAEGDESWGNDRPLAERTGIHVFRVRVGQDATRDTGGPDEVHILGRQTPVASLSIETHRNTGPQPTSAQNTWAGWLAEVIEADKNSRAGLASSSMQLTPTDDIEEAKRTGRPLSILRPGTMPPKTQSAYDEINDIMDRSLQEALELSKRYQDVWDRNPTPPYSDEEKDAIEAKNKIRNELLQPALNAAFANLNRALIEEYKPLGFNEDDLYIVTQGILNHLNEKRSYLYGIYGQPEFWGDEARLQHSVEALDEADIAIAFPKDLLEQLIQDGRFKTQFETKSSRGSLHPAGRKQTDVAQFGYHPDTAPEMRPVFGYLTKGGVIDKSTLGSIKQYGELQFILKRDTHSRSTYTTHDSLSTGLTPSPMGVPSKDASGKVGETMYAEAQIHGGLSLSDVDYVVINVGEPDQWDWQNNKVAQEEFESISGMLATVGIRVVPVRDGEVVDTWNGGKTTTEQPAEVVTQSQEPVKVVA